MSNQDLVVAENVCRTYGTLTVLENVVFRLGEGEVIGLIGPNGGGKSTLLQSMAGLVRPSSGTLTVCGHPAHEVALHSHGQVGLITAEVGLYPLLTGWENLHYFGSLYHLDRDAITQRAEPVLDRLGIAGMLDRPAGALSSGMKQKISLCRALLMEPRLLLLDEPTANLDPVSTHKIHQVVREQADNGVSVVLCTHDLHAAAEICDRVLVLERTVKADMAISQLPEQEHPLLHLYETHVEAR